MIWKIISLLVFLLAIVGIVVPIAISNDCRMWIKRHIYPRTDKQFNDYFTQLKEGLQAVVLELNAKYKDRAEIITIDTRMPVLQKRGETFSKSGINQNEETLIRTDNDADAIRSWLSSHGHANEETLIRIDNDADAIRSWLSSHRHANKPKAHIVDFPPSKGLPRGSTSEVTRLEFLLIDYATTMAWIKNGITPCLLSTLVLAVTPDTRKVFIHYRSKNSDTEACRYHLLGGTFIPEEQAPSERITDYEVDTQVVDTLLREFQEESGYQCSNRPHGPVVIGIEHARVNRSFGDVEVSGAMDFLQVVYLGLEVKEMQETQPPRDSEGKVELKKLADIQKWHEHKWATSGAMYVELWLRCGVPTVSKLFAGSSEQREVKALADRFADYHEATDVAEQQ